MSQDREINRDELTSGNKSRLTISNYLILEKEILDNVVIVRPEGAIYIPEAEQFDQFMKEIIKQENFLILLNFKKVRQLPSLVFATIIQTFKLCRSKGGDLRLCSIPPALMRVFVTMQFDRIFSIYQDEEEAIASFHQE